MIECPDYCPVPCYVMQAGCLPFLLIREGSRDCPFAVEYIYYIDLALADARKELYGSVPKACHLCRD